MGQALNTTVNGSSGTCIDAADWLSRLFAGARDADSAARDARAAAEGGWQGPAADAFAEDLHGLPAELAELADRAYECEWALREFAASLDKAVDTMSQALDKARARDLRVEGPFIIAPQPPEAITGLPTGKCTPADAQAAARKLNGDIAALREAQAAYNAKAAAYNECKALVEDARRFEKRAHEQLRQSMTTVSEAATNWVTIGSFTVARMLGYVGSIENPRRDALNNVNRELNKSRFLTKWANGTVASASPLQQRVLEMAAEKARNAEAYRARVDEFEKFIKVVPEPARRAVTAYPGKGALDDAGSHAKTLPAGAKNIARSMPYLGSLVTATAESIGALKGEQSWGKAAADTAGVVVGGGLGAAGAGAAYGALTGASLGPIGSVVVGTVGGVAGGIGGQLVTDWLVPE